MSTRLLRSFSTVGVWTLGSRFLGFFREILIAAFFGGGVISDAFYAAFLLPNLFRRFLGEGTLNQAFVPLLTQKKDESEDEAVQFADQAFSGLFTVLMVLYVLAMLFMPFLVLATAGGFWNTPRFDPTVHFGRIMFIYVVFMALGALCSGILNSYGRFAAAAAAPIALNVIVIFSLLLGYFLHGDIASFLVWSVPIAGLVQFLIVFIAVKRMGFPLRLVRPRWSDDMRTLVHLALPALLTGGVVQINLVVGRQIASQFPGAIAWLNYADRLFQLPLGVVGVAVGVVLLPALSASVSKGQIEESRENFSRAVSFSMLLTLPAAVGLAVLALPLVNAIYERGAFMADDSYATALALLVYSIGLPAAVLQKACIAAYSANKNTKTPFRFASISVAVNIILALSLIPFFGFLAPPIATTCASFVTLFLYWRGLSRYGEDMKLLPSARKAVIHFVIAAIIMGVAIYFANLALLPMAHTGFVKWLLLGLIIGLGALVYFGAIFLFSGVRLRELKGYFRR